jgi:predicted porin
MVNPEYATQADDSVEFTTNTDLVFKGSEDLGNGMTASFKYHIFHDGDVTSATATAGSTGGKVADTSVSIAGDFGTVTAGRMESFHEAVAQGFANIDASHNADLENTMTEAGIGDRVNGAVAYVSPSFNGLTVGVASISLNDADDDGSDATDVMVKYSNAGLTVFAEKFDVDGGAQAQAYGASYKMGDIEVRAMQRTHETVAGVESDATFFGAKYTMGNIVLAAGTMDEDTNGDSTILSAEYKLGKRTSAYIVDMNSDMAAEEQTVI